MNLNKSRQKENVKGDSVQDSQKKKKPKNKDQKIHKRECMNKNLIARA